MSNAHEMEMPGVADVLQTVVFKTLWDRVPNKSFVSGMWLRTYANTPLWQNCVMRVLPARDYQGFQYYFGNLVLVLPSERALWEQASEEQRITYALDIEEKTRGKGTADWNAVKDLAEDLKVLYAKHFPSTRGMIVNYRYTLTEQEKIIGRLNKQFWMNFYK